MVQTARIFVRRSRLVPCCVCRYLLDINNHLILRTTPPIPRCLFCPARTVSANFSIPARLRGSTRPRGAILRGEPSCMRPCIYQCHHLVMSFLLFKKYYFFHRQRTRRRGTCSTITWALAHTTPWESLLRGSRSERHPLHHGRAWR